MLSKTKMGNKSSNKLREMLSKARDKVEVGGQYVHFKSPDRSYTVLNIAFLEETEEPCVIYKANYGDDFIWVRTVKNWLEMKKTETEIVPRFQKKNQIPSQRVSSNVDVN